MKLYKRLLFFILGLLLLGAATVFVALTFYKKELTQVVIDELKVKYGLSLKVEEVNVSFFSNWPHTSVQLKGVCVSSDLNKKTKDDFLKAGSLSVSFNLLKLFQKQFIVRYISLKDVDLHLVKFADGSKNFEIKKVKDTVQSGPGLSLNLDQINLKNVRFHFVNEIRKQNIAVDFKENVIRLKNYEEGLGLSLVGNVLIRELLFNPKAGEFLKYTQAKLNLEGAYFKADKEFCFYPPSYAEIEGHRYNLCSLIKLGENKNLKLIIESKNVNSTKVARYLTPRIKKVLANYKMEHTVDAKLILDAKLGGTVQPVFIVDVIGQGCDLKIGTSKIPFSELNFKGRIMSMHPSKTRGDMEHSSIVFKDIKGKINDFPFKADLKILDLPAPKIDLHSSIVVDGKNIHLEDSKGIKLTGTGLASIHYAGNARNLTKERFLSDSMNMNIYLLFTNFRYQKAGSDMDYLFNGKASIDKEKLELNDFEIKTTVGDLMISGRAEQFFQYLFGIKNILKANIEAKARSLDMNPLFGEKKEVKAAPLKDNSTSELLKRSIFDIDLHLSTPMLRFRQIETERVDVRLNIKKERIDISQLKIHACKGDIDLKARIKNMNKIDCEGKINNVDVTQLFKEFEDFGQEAIKSENLKGKIFAEGSFSSEISEQNKFKGETVKADVKVILKDGHLVNYEPLQNISIFVLKRKQFEDVSFSELDETFRVRGYEMRIDELEINSNVLNLYIVNGLYSTHGNSNINMLIPWNNLRRLGMNFIPKGEGKTADQARGLKLNYSGPPQKMKLSLGHKEQEQRFW